MSLSNFVVAYDSTIGGTAFTCIVQFLLFYNDITTKLLCVVTYEFEERNKILNVYIRRMEAEKNVAPLPTLIYIGNQTLHLKSFKLIPQGLINIVCRTCLTSNSCFQSIFESDIDKMIMSFASVQIFQGDGLSSQICLNCVDQINQAYTFKQQVESSDYALKQHYLHKKTKDVQEPIKEYLEDTLNLGIVKCEIDESVEVASSLPNTPVYENAVDTKENLKRADNSSDDSSSSSCSNDHDSDYIPSSDGNSSDGSFDEYFSKIDSTQDPLSHIENGVLSTANKLKHMRRKNYICPICGTKWIGPSHLKVHMRSHTGERPYKCEIPNCNKSFICTSNFNRHVQSHTGLKKHVCSICGKKWISTTDLKIHMRIHTGEKPYKCLIPNCNKSFKSSSDLNKHIRCHTANSKLKRMRGRKHVCTVCGKRWICPSDLKIHMRTHTGERPYKCEIPNCEKRFICVSTLRKHTKTHIAINENNDTDETRNYICSICGKKWSTPTHLKVHMRSHSGERPYKCEISYCNKSFKSNTHLKRHGQSHRTANHKFNHSGIRKYVCSVCGKKWITPTHLKVHMRSHTGEKPYKCKILNCNKSFISTSNLNKHVRSHSEMSN